MRSILIAYFTGFVFCWYFAALVRNKEVEIGPIESVEQFYSEKPTVKLWHGTDSVAMEFIYLANTYLCLHREAEALVLYKHACTLDHGLPGVFLSTGMLYYFSGDFENAQTYFKLEIEHGKRFVDRHVLSKQFAIDMYESYLLLEDPGNAETINRKYHLTTNSGYSL
jgi:tetratricopeptide (TPR) repeat protein